MGLQPLFSLKLFISYCFPSTILLRPSRFFSSHFETHFLLMFYMSLTLSYIINRSGGSWHPPLMMQSAAHLAISTKTQKATRPTHGTKSLLQPVVAVTLMDKTIPITHYLSQPSSTTTTPYSCQAPALHLRSGRSGDYHHHTPVSKSTPKKI